MKTGELETTMAKLFWDMRRVDAKPLPKDVHEEMKGVVLLDGFLVSLENKFSMRSIMKEYKIKQYKVNSRASMMEAIENTLTGRIRK